MEVTFASNRLFKLCTKEKKRARKLGHQRANELKLVLDELHAAPSLADIKQLPHLRLHALKGSQTGQYSVDIDAQYRVWFKIIDDEDIRDEHGSINFSDITAIVITEVGDPHD